MLQKFYESATEKTTTNVDDLYDFMIAYAIQSTTRYSEIVPSLILVKNLTDFNKEYGIGGQRRYILRDDLQLYDEAKVDFENIDKDEQIYELIIGDEIRINKLTRLNEEIHVDVYQIESIKTMKNISYIAVPKGEDSGDAEDRFDNVSHLVDDDDFEDTGDSWDVNVSWKPVMTDVTLDDANNEYTILNYDDIEKEFNND